MKVNNFDVLKQMAEDNLDIRLATDLVGAKKVKAGTQITVGIGGDAVGAIFSGDLHACLILFNKKQFEETKRKLSEPLPDPPSTVDLDKKEGA